MKKTIEKIIVSLLIATFIAPSFSYATGIPVVDVVNTTQSTLNTVKEYGLDTLAVTLTQTLSTKIANKVFNKANGGASGDSSSQSLITNFSDYFSNLSTQQIDKFVTDIGISKNPYATDIAKGIITSTQNLSRGQNALESFNLDRVIGTNWKEFSNDVSIGGWDGILALSNPANTNIGASLIAKQELANKIQQEIENEKIKLTSPGTKPQGKCNLNFTQYKKEIQNSRAVPSTTIGADGKPITDDRAVPSTTIGADGKPITDDRAVPSTTVGVDGKPITGLIEEYGGCLQEIISNPVGLVTTGLDNALKLGSDRLANGDELGELIGGVLTTMLSTFIKSGLTALQADFQSDRNTVGGPEQLVAQNGQTIPWTQAPQTIVDLREELPIALSSTNEEVTDLRNFIQKVTEDSDGTYASTVTKLDQCIPGPDYGYEKRLSAYLSKQTKRLEKRKDKGKDKKTVPKNNALENIDASVDAAKVYTGLSVNDPFSNIPGSGIMLAQVAIINNVSTRYQDAKSELTKKQITLNLLYSIEGSLQSQIQLLKTNGIPTIPTKIVFSPLSWERLSVAEKNNLVVWAKSINNVPANAPLSTPEWNNLSATQKTSLVAWATETTGEKKPSTITEKDFVLGAVFIKFGNISPTTNSDDIRREISISTAWNVWSNPEQYMQNPWDSNSAEAVRYLELKNKSRGDYQGIQNDVSLPYTAQRAKTNLRQLESIIDETKKLQQDCETFRQLVLNENTIDRNATNAHDLLKKYLVQNKNRFKSSLFIQELETGPSILSKPVINDQNKFSSVYNNLFFECGSLGNNCYLTQNELLTPTFGLEDDESELSDDAQKSSNILQSQPAKNIWELLQKNNGENDTAFCGFNKFLATYPGTLPNPTLDGGKSILCSTEWNKINFIEFRNLIYGSDEFDSYFSTGPG